MNQLNTNSGGVTNFQALSTGELYIKGRRFIDYINEIVFEDNLDDAEVAEIQAFLSRLDISNLTGDLIINDSNRNSVLLSAIQALQNKLNFLDTSGLTQTWTVVDNNRNSVLKSEIDSQSGTISGIQSTISGIQSDVVSLQSKTQYITSSSNTITINADTINIGQYNALTPSTSTNLRGDIYTNQAYFKSLNTSSIFGWSDFITLINSTNIPSYVASAVITSVLSFMPSDILRMNGTVSKSGDIQTTNDVRVSEFKMFNTSVVGLDILSKFLVFMMKGNFSVTTGLGDISLQTFSGHIFMRNNNISTTAIDWATTEARDKCNIVSIQNNDILIHLGAASSGGDIEIINSCSGDIVFKNGTNGLKSGTTSVMKIKYNANFLDQIEMGLIDPNLNWATNNSKLFVVQLYNQTNGITVGSPDVFPGTNHKFSHLNSTNVNTGALILQDGYSGTTNKAIYTVENGQKLFYSGQQVYPPLPQNVGGVGITYIVRNPTSTTAPATLTMSETYSSQPSQSITLSSYNNNTTYLMATIRGLIPVFGNPIISGVIQHEQWTTYTANQTGQIWDVVNFRATSTQSVVYDHPTEGNTTYNNVLRYIYPKTNTTEINVNNQSVFTAFIPVCNNSATLTLHSITITRVALSNTGGINNFVRLELVNAIGGVIHTFTDVAYSNGIAQTITFGGSLTTINISNTTAVRFKFTNLGTTNPSIIQTALTGAQGVNGLMYIIHGSASQIYSTLLYDGINNKTTLTNNATSNYILTLPISTMDITQLYEPNLEIETKFIQPSGTTTNHSVALLYNDGYLSHVDSTFSITTAVPTIQQVLTAGNNAGNLDITSLGTISPSAITGWNVKEISAGTNISRTISSGTYTIANTAPVQDVSAGDGISIVKSSGTATITNSGIRTATAGSNISVSVVNNNLNITNTANVTDVIAGNGITVSVAGGTATISQSLFMQIGNANDLSTTESTVKGQKAQSFYGTRWRQRSDINTNSIVINDVCVSPTGQYIYIAGTGTAMYYSTDYGNLFLQTTYNNLAASKWVALAMSSTGKRVYMLGTTDINTTTNWRLHISSNYGASWTLRPNNLGLDDISTAVPLNICCSGSGEKILFTDARAGSSGKVYSSGDSGTNFNTFNVASGVTLSDDCAMSSNGQIQFITTNESTGGLTHAAIYRSSNFGNTWTKAYTKVSGDSDFGQIDCDTTGRIVVCCRKGGATRNNYVLSLDYGVSFSEMTGTNARSVSITPNGYRIWFGLTGGLVAYSDNYGDNVIAKDAAQANVNIERISTNADGTTVFTSSSNYIWSYMERFKIEEMATQHYFSYTSNILQAENQAHRSFPLDMDLQNFEYYITFDFHQIYFNKYIHIGFNGTDTCAYNYNALYYSTVVSSVAETLKTAEYSTATGNVFQASDAGNLPIFFSPTDGSFFYCSASIQFRVYAPSQKVFIMERMNEPFYRTQNSSLAEGKGVAGTLADNVGANFRTIRGKIDIVSLRAYLPGTTNSRWCPDSFAIYYIASQNANVANASVRISDIQRKAKNKITY